MTDATAPTLATTLGASREGVLARLRRRLLVLRFALVNVVAVGLTAATWMQGWLDGALTGNTLWPTVVITAVFLYGLVLCTARVQRVGRSLDAVRGEHVAAGSRAAQYLDAVAECAPDSRIVQAGLLRLRLSQDIGVVRHVANTLVLLGLVGTVIGFIIALSGVNPDLSASVDNVGPMVSTLIAGMSIALYTTLIGAVLHVWLMVCYRMLASGSVQLYDAIVALGETRVGR
jgi:hypothetical protein